jgi:acetyl-CoA synthetase
MEAGQEVQLSEAQIAVHWREEEYYDPPASFIGQANAADPAIFERFSEEHFPECFKEYADLLTWNAYWHTTLDTSNPPFWKWFVGGRLNACFNCVDRHLASSRSKAALIWVPEPETEEVKAVTYQELYGRVNEFAALLRDFGGVQAGDRVTFHLPMVPELPVSMLACARLGTIGRDRRRRQDASVPVPLVGAEGGAKALIADGRRRAEVDSLTRDVPRRVEVSGARSPGR